MRPLEVASDLLRSLVDELPQEAKDGPWEPMGRKGTVVGVLIQPGNKRGPASLLADCTTDSTDGQDLLGDMAITAHICTLADPVVAAALAALLERFHELAPLAPVADLAGQIGHLEHLLLTKVAD